MNIREALKVAEVGQGGMSEVVSEKLAVNLRPEVGNGTQAYDVRDCGADGWSIVG